MTDDQLVAALGALRDGTGVRLRSGLPPDEVLAQRRSAVVFTGAWLEVLGHLTEAQRHLPLDVLVPGLAPATREALVDLVVLASHEATLP